MFVCLAEHYWIVHSMIHKVVNQCTLLSKTILMVAYAHHHSLRIMPETGYVFFRWCSVWQNHEFNCCLTLGYKRQCVVWKDGECICFTFPYIKVYDVFLSLYPIGRHFTTNVYEVRVKSE